jgi:hypothetical protein
LQAALPGCACAGTAASIAMMKAANAGRCGIFCSPWPLPH